jgi:mannitol-1-/sugar-/sorbitol-6-phosphatase
MPAFGCAVIFFDLDGVLVDSTRSVERLWRRWANENQINEQDVLAVVHGVRTIEVVTRFAPQLDAVAEVRKIEQREASDGDGIAEMPGASELLRSIPEGCWSIVTSGTRLLALSRLQFAKLPIPPLLVTADEVSNGKPHPEPYLKAAALLDIPPQQCLVIEDAPAGIRAAHAGGMKVIGLTSTYHHSELQEADAVVEKLTQIKVLLQSDGQMRISIAG